MKRNFIAGSEWLYYKIYTGPKTADSILTDLVYNVVSEFEKNSNIEKWFFIRYQDPEFHLRIRFKPNKDKAHYVFNSFNNYVDSLVKEGLIWKLQIDTYKREIERYGLQTMEASEMLFYHDSNLILNLLNLIDDNEEGERLRWLFGLKLIDTFLNSFNFDDEQKLGLLEKMKMNFCSEFNMDKQLKKQLDRKFIDSKKDIFEFISLTSDTNSNFKPLISLIYQKHDKCKPTITEILDKMGSENLNSFLSSHIHMKMNRLFRSKNRLHEMVIYYFMFKYYRVKIGRAKNNIKIEA